MKVKKWIITTIAILTLWWVGIIPTIIASIEGGFYDMAAHLGEVDTDKYYNKLYDILDDIETNSLRAMYVTPVGISFMYRHGGLAYYLKATNNGLTLCDYVLERMVKEGIDRPDDKVKIETYKKNIERHVIDMSIRCPSLWQDIIFSSTLKI